MADTWVNPAYDWGAAYQASLKPVADPYASLSSLKGFDWNATVQGFASGDLGGIGAAMVYGNGSGVPTGGGSTTPPAEDPYTKWLKEEQARIERLRTMNAIAVLGAQMDALGLGSLSGKITAWIQEGYDGDAVQALIRQTPEYAARFPAMKALQAKGLSISEGEYIAYEQTMASYEKLFGLPGGMLTDKDRVTKMLVNGISAREVEERVTMASASMYQLPEEYRQTMRNYYGVDSGGLTAYFLDPDAAKPLLERQFVTAKIGSEGAMQGLSVARGMSEFLYERGVDENTAREGFGRVAGAMSLTAGRGDTVSQDTLTRGTFGLDAQAKKDIERAAGGRVARFEGGGSFATDSGGVAGIGSASS